MEHHAGAGKTHHDLACFIHVDEAVVLFRSCAGHRLEPVRVVRGAVLDGPFLHGVRHDVGHLDVERIALLDGAHESFVRDGRQALGHHMLVEHEGSVDIGYVRRHSAFPFAFACIRLYYRRIARSAREPPRMNNTFANGNACSRPQGNCADSSVLREKRS